jgi:hypothetical protein
MKECTRSLYIYFLQDLLLIQSAFRRLGCYLLTGKEYKGNVGTRQRVIIKGVVFKRTSIVVLITSPHECRGGGPAVPKIGSRVILSAAN